MEREKKECILRSAAAAFARFGFKKASVEEIAKDAGVAKGTVYLACETKEDLFYQAVHREVRAWVAEVAKVIDPRVPADQLLLQCGTVAFQYIQDRPLVRQLLLGEYNLMLPEWQDRMAELRELGRANVVEVLRLGQKQGIFRAELEVEEVARIIQDLETASWMFEKPTQAFDERLQKRLTVGIDLLMNGLRKQA